MKKQLWLIRALLLGFVFSLALTLVKPIGVSTQFSMVSGLIHSSVVADVIKDDPAHPGKFTSENPYYAKSGGKLIKSMKNPLNYGFIFALSIPLGAYAAHLRHKKEEEDYIRKNPLPKISSTKQFLGGFIGGFLTLYGARLAGGCTSGHMMSGMMQSSVSGYVFAAAVFAFAIPTAILVKRFSKTTHRR